MRRFVMGLMFVFFVSLLALACAKKEEVMEPDMETSTMTVEGVEISTGV